MPIVQGLPVRLPHRYRLASYKAEVLYQSYKRRIRPRSHYVLGQLPRWVRMASRVPRIANRALSLGDLLPLLKEVAGVDPRRSLPILAPQTFRGWAAAHGVTEFAAAKVTGNQVLLMVDTFTNHFSPNVGQAMVTVLRDAGYEPVLTPRPQCCGLTWISTGQLDAAKRILSSTIDDLHGPAKAGLPIVGIESSCTVVLRHEATELVTTDEAVLVSASTVTLAELLTRTPGWTPPDLRGRQVIAQPHCHHHAVMGWSADADLLKRAGAAVTQLGGSCGLAGNFGVELGHYDVSAKVAENALLPAIRHAEPDDVILADGFSCKTQLSDLANQNSIHLAQLLAAALPESARAGTNDPSQSPPVP